jgi:hypothetical protein
MRYCFLVPFFFPMSEMERGVGRSARFELHRPRGFNYLTLRLGFSLPILTCAFSYVDGGTYATGVLLSLMPRNT